jgi:hypothetical protein
LLGLGFGLGFGPPGDGGQAVGKGRLQLLRMASFAADLALQQGRAGSVAPDATQHLLETYPGPLTSASGNVREKVSVYPAPSSRRLAPLSDTCKGR